MSLFSIINLLITISCLSLAYFIAKYAENSAHRLWAYFNCAVATWAFAVFFVGISHDAHQALFFWKIAYTGCSFISAGFYHFVSAYYNINNKKRVILCYAEAVIFSLLFLFTNLCIDKTRPIFDVLYYHQATPLFGVWFLLWGFIVLSAFYEFILQLRIDRPDRIPSMVIFVAMLIGFIGGTTTALPAYGIMFYPAWQIGICLHVLLIGYGIFYHQLLPINVVLKRSIIYSLLVTMISLTYFLSILVSQQLFRQYFGYSSTIIVSIFIAIAFIPIKNKIQSFVDRHFLKATPMEIAQQIEQLRQKEKTLVDLYNQADKLSKTDTLTETNNRRYFTEMLKKKMQDCEGTQTFFYLVIFDVDRFKEINDGYGHALGDMVLVKVVEVVKNNIRSNDFVGRFGGDEFMICLDFPNKEMILNRLTKIRDDVKALSFTHEDKQVPISVSIGAAKFMPGTHMTEKSLMEMADTELFNVKKTTRGEISINK